MKFRPGMNRNLKRKQNRKQWEFNSPASSSSRIIKQEERDRLSFKIEKKKWFVHLYLRIKLLFLLERLLKIYLFIHVYQQIDIFQAIIFDPAPPMHEWLARTTGIRRPWLFFMEILMERMQAWVTHMTRQDHSNLYSSWLDDCKENVNKIAYSMKQTTHDKLKWWTDWLLLSSLFVWTTHSNSCWKSLYKMANPLGR